ncbi:SIR2 family NAD-dependent protein deacylase [Roseivirga misakiensis]|uniref:NAD-dependent protein deacylase n=1 Tax=Roseivirga misakiensis TaxID=1563681 RepID=A0A1E5SZ69_9BACT|nr:NAD-dependent deacylase [Roseivirga misakiensis]OEK04428.1 NAD-dependent protein deacylase [Roseivirga misakiensis]
MKKLVVLTGAGISAESGIKTFRDADGLWEGHDVMEVASPNGWFKNPGLVLEFYNQRRKQALSAKPNAAHFALAELQSMFDVQIITQNVDNLHEKAGSRNVHHLHGQLFQSRSTIDEELIYNMDDWPLNLGDLCEKGSQLRPNIVWFGEAVPMMELAIEITTQADIFLVVGTSLQVYPAAGLIDYAPDDSKKFLIDPKKPILPLSSQVHFIQKNATTGMQEFKELVLG